MVWNIDKNLQWYAKLVEQFSQSLSKFSNVHNVDNYIQSSWILAAIAAWWTLY